MKIKSLILITLFLVSASIAFAQGGRAAPREATTAPSGTFVASRVVWIAFDFFSAMIGNGFREEARAVIVDVWIEVIGRKTVDERSMSLGNVRVSQMFEHDRAILRFGEGIVV